MMFVRLIAMAGGARAAEPITGRWITDDGKAEVTIAECKAVVWGHIRKILAPRSKGPLQGLEVLSGFTTRANEWRGRIYDPERGTWGAQKATIPKRRGQRHE